MIVNNVDEKKVELWLLNNLKATKIFLVQRIMWSNEYITSLYT